MIGREDDFNTKTFAYNLETADKKCWKESIPFFLLELILKNIHKSRKIASGLKQKFQAHKDQLVQLV